MPSFPTRDSPSWLAALTGARMAAVGAVAVAAWYDSFRVVPAPPIHGFFDLRVYRGAVLWWLHGRPLYAFQMGHGHYGFTYPPFAALVMSPLAWLTSVQAAIITTVASALVVVVITVRLITPLARRHGWRPWFAVALAVPVVFAVDPIRESLGFGQLNMLIFALVLLDLGAMRRGRAWAGAGIGLATALKLTPGLFVVFLLLSGRRRPAAVATAVFLGATLLAFAASAPTSREFWMTALWDTSRVGRLDRPGNQSVLGLLAHLADPAQPDRRLWVVLVGAVLAVGMWRAVRAYRRGDDLVAFTLVGLTACLVSPISWTHHLYWVVPALVVLVDVAAGSPVHGDAPGWLGRRPRAVARGAGALAVLVAVPFVLSIPWHFLPVPGAPPAGVPVDILGRSAYTCLLLALLVLLPARDDLRTGVSAAGPSEARTTALSRPGGWSPR